MGGEKTDPDPMKYDLEHEHRYRAVGNECEQPPRLGHDRRMPIGELSRKGLCVLPETVGIELARPTHDQIEDRQAARKSQYLRGSHGWHGIPRFT